VVANASVKFAWTPSAAQLEAANVTRLARVLGCDGYAALHRVSVDEPDRFWRAVAADLELDLARPWDAVRDDSRGIEWTTWFEGAQLNIAQACLHAWAERTPDAVAAVSLRWNKSPSGEAVVNSRVVWAGAQHYPPPLQIACRRTASPRSP